MDNNALCIITARGGSKRIPRKNIKDFCGKPIIAYSIEAALGSNIFDEVMVSTDDQEIASIARSFGASVPFMRSSEASTDFATSTDVLNEVLAEYEKRGSEFDILACVYPTAPFITARELVEASNLLNADDINSVVAVTEYDFPPQRAFLMKEDGSLNWERSKYATFRSQDLPRTVHDCGRFCFSKVKAWKASRSFLGDGCVGYYIDPLAVQDIDTLSDWDLAELKYKAWEAKKGPDNYS